MYNDLISIKTRSFSIDFKLKSLINVNIALRDNEQIQLINVMDNLGKICKTNIIQTNIDIDDIVICKNKNDIDLLLLKQAGTRGKTIFIDKYDKIYSEELTRFIMSGQNRVIINSRVKYNDLKLNTESLIVIKYNRDKHVYYSQNVLDISEDERIELL